MWLLENKLFFRVALTGLMDTLLVIFSHNDIIAFVEN